MENRIGFGKRLGAWLLDLVIVAVLVGVAGSIVAGALGLATASLGDPSATASPEAMQGAMMGAVMAAMGVAFVIGCIYFLIEGFTGYTLGKLILGIRVANEDGTLASVPTLLSRFALKNIGSVLGIVAIITGISFLNVLGNVGALIIFVGCFLVLGMSRQALHDRIVHTAVYPKNLVRAGV
jgi:uncharacterized RDD family membrane protein YckC